MRSHAPFEPIVTKFCMWGQVDDVITDVKFYENRLRGLELQAPKRHFLYLTLIALTTVSALPCCSVIDDVLISTVSSRAGFSWWEAWGPWWRIWDFRKGLAIELQGFKN